jgi:uncharacterized membrane protein YraQ (UPF0718 family)
MTEKNHNPLKDTSFLVFAGIAVIAGALCYAKGEDFFRRGVEASVSMTLDVLPRLLAAFLLAGFVEVLMPRDLIRKWIGDKSGLTGIVIASLAGALTPGGPMASFPLIAALYKLGADFGPLVAYLTAWELIAVQRMVVWEIPFMGTRFVLFRLLVSLPLPILAGMIARTLAARFGDFDRMREKS